MKLIIVVITAIILLPIYFKEPSASGQTKILEKISLPTPEQKEARILGIENDKRSLAINNEIHLASEHTTANDKLKIEVNKYKKLVAALTKENEYYKERLTRLKNNLLISQTATQYLQQEIDAEDYFIDSTKSIFKTDTIYLPPPVPTIHRNILKRLFKN